MTSTEDDIDAAGRSLQDLAEGPAQEAADAIAQAFERAGSRIETSLATSARSGAASFSGLADSILRDMARLAAETLIEAPLRGALQTTLSGLPFFGARAEGGPVTPGGSYLVGERGPEIFTPGVAGQVGEQAAPVSINLTLARTDAAGTRLPSEVQIGRAVHRAILKGRRYS